MFLADSCDVRKEPRLHICKDELSTLVCRPYEVEIMDSKGMSHSICRCCRSRTSISSFGSLFRVIFPSLFRSSHPDDMVSQVTEPPTVVL